MELGCAQRTPLQFMNTYDTTSYGDASMHYPLVSIHIICYNQEQYIRQALVSAVEQDYQNLEVVVADDCSTDRTRALIDEVIASYPSIRIIKLFNPHNLGITGNSNAGLTMCKGEFIAFMGGDDVLLPGKIKQQVQWFGEHEGAVLCGHDVDWIDQHGDWMHKRSSDFVPMLAGKGAAGFISNGTPFAATSIMVRRSRIPSYGFHPQLPVVSDWKLWIDVIGKEGHYGYIPGIWAQYRRHSRNVTAKRSWRITRDVFMTCILSLWHFRGRYFGAWLQYFMGRLPV